MNSENWPASNVWVFTAQLVEHCSANAEAKGSNPVEGPEIFYFIFRVNLQLLNCKYHCDDHIFIQICVSAVHINFNDNNNTNNNDNNNYNNNNNIIIATPPLVSRRDDV